MRREVGRGLDRLGGAGSVGVGEQAAAGQRFEQLHGVLLTVPSRGAGRTAGYA